MGNKQNGSWMTMDLHEVLNTPLEAQKLQLKYIGQVLRLTSPPYRARAIARRDEILREVPAQPSVSKVIQVVHKIWASLGQEKPAVMVARSPREANEFAHAVRRTFAKEGRTKDELPVFVNSTTRFWMAWLTALRECTPIPISSKVVKEALEWCEVCQYMIAWRGMAIVSLPPVEVHWENNELHKEDGPAVLFKDGVGLWFLRGRKVTPKMVKSLHSLSDAEKTRLKEDDRELWDILVQHHAKQTDTPELIWDGPAETKENPQQDQD